MENLDKLQAKVDQLISMYEKLERENRQKQLENDQLHDQVKSLETRLKSMGEVNSKLEKTLQEKNDTALKRISKLVDRIDQFQTDMKIS